MWFFKVALLVAFAGRVAASDIGGSYTDPNHYRTGTFQGTRYISDQLGDSDWHKLTMIGSDDGESFWTLGGSYDKVTGDLTVDFSPKGGPEQLSGNYANGVITWDDGNMWTKGGEPACEAEMLV